VDVAAISSMKRATATLPAPLILFKSNSRSPLDVKMKMKCLAGATGGGNEVDYSRYSRIERRVW